MRGTQPVSLPALFPLSSLFLSRFRFFLRCFVVSYSLFLSVSFFFVVSSSPFSSMWSSCLSLTLSSFLIIPPVFFSSPSFSCFHSRSFSCFSSLISIFLPHFPDLFSLIFQFLLFFISCLLLPHFPVFLYFPFSSPSLSNFSSSSFLVFYSP